ncbi:MAG: ISAzo13 family transposase [Burkholderiaceae bacterium]|nr:ISAzo13 family transposase [Burkholderiaceae bacterium]
MVDDEFKIAEKYEALCGVMDEQMRRLWSATEARALGYGGVSTVARAVGLTRPTITAGMKELGEARQLAPMAPKHRVRREGAGRPRVTDIDAGLRPALEELVEPATRGHPMSPLRWTCKSVRTLATELTRQGHAVSHQTVSEVLQNLGYSLQANRKTREGSEHPDRNAQFEHIARRAKEFQQRSQPVISVDTKKKELVGDFKNSGREWHPQGRPPAVRVHDFQDDELGKAIPYGVYDLGANAGWVSVGIDHDTPEFAVESIYCWWRQMGRKTYPEARDLLITADGGGSNGSRTRLWKVALQRLADVTGLKIGVCHFPPGTSKWNKIEHRMFCHITRNWRGRPLESLEVVVNLIASTTTTKGLRVRAALDTDEYPTGIKVDDATMASLHLIPDEFHGEWNYAIIPTGSGRISKQPRTLRAKL